MNAADPTEHTLDDEGSAFEAVVLEPAKSRVSVLFAVGAGGGPERYLPMLQALAAHGCTVVAPRFERLASPMPSADVLEMRARRLRLAFDRLSKPHRPAAGVGHSIWASLLLMLAGGEASTIAQEAVQVSPERRLKRLALMAPATDLFKAPGALRDVGASIIAWAGTRDEVTPPETAQMLERALHGIVPVEVRIILDAGHFSFMNMPPPQAMEPLIDRDTVLERIAQEVVAFITS